MQEGEERRQKEEGEIRIGLEERIEIVTETIQEKRREREKEGKEERKRRIERRKTEEVTVDGFSYFRFVTLLFC